MRQSVFSSGNVDIPMDLITTPRSELIRIIYELQDKVVALD